jgi:hypothetical protein
MGKVEFQALLLLEEYMKAFATCMIAAALCLNGCGIYRADRQSTHDVIQTTPEYTLGIVEFDDQGWFVDRAEAGTVVKAIDQAASQGGAAIVIFIHGWHHSARPDDSDLRDFKAALSRLHQEIELPIYKSARAKLYNSPDARVIGLYVGWRGRSLPGSLDYLTPWDRKAAAVRVGNGDVAELLTRVHNIYEKYNKPPMYTTLVTIGHSFGAQVTFAAVADILKGRAASAISLTDLHEPAAPISGFGDVVVLVNPAFEASVFHSMSELTRARTFTKKQTPVLLIVSSEADGVNKSFFPISRFLSVFDEPFGSSSQFREKTRALGWVPSQLTHCLALAAGKPCAGFPDTHVAARNAANKEPIQAVDLTSGTNTSTGFDAAAAVRNAGVWKAEDAASPERIELSGELGLAGTRFYRADASIDVNLPFVVAKATRDVMHGHNDMFDPLFVNFLVRYVGGATLKRLSMRLNESPISSTQ